MASQDMVHDAAPARLRQASVNERDGRAALFAAGLCVLGGLAFLASQLGWWIVLAGPAYLAGVVTTAILSRGRANALLAVALSTASMGILIGLIKLSGLA